MPHSTTLRHLVASTLLTFACLAWTAPAHAFRMIQNTTAGRVTAGNLVTCNDPGGFVHWTNPNISWYLNTAGQGAGKAAALQAALSSWTNVANADHVLTYAGTTTAGWSTDGVNTVLWANGNGCTGSCLALTALVLQQPGQIILETDVTFNSNYTWQTNGSDYDTQAVAAHELGHSLGIHHTEIATTPYPTMRASYFGSGGRSLETDDHAALQCAQSRYPFPGGGGAPPTPASLTVFREYCYGLNTLSWSASTGATSYELYGSTSSTFTSQWLEYSGTGTFDVVNVSTTTYYRVRACNASGCSGYRVGNQSALHYSGCL